VTPDEWRSRLRGELVTAMKARDKAATTALRSTIAAIDNAEAADVDEAPDEQDGRIAGGVAGLRAGEVDRRQLSAEDVLSVIRAEAAERRAAADEYRANGRHDRADELAAEASVVEALLG
jgi:uncharacterized protein YqeY